MEDIYDRSKWPQPEANPLVVLLQRGDEWYSNKEINAALSLCRAGKKPGIPMADIKRVMRIIGESESIVSSPGQVFQTSQIAANRTGGVERFYSRKALVLLCLRANTANAAAFRDWLASRTAGEVVNG
jgi:hypothetical protein